MFELKENSLKDDSVDLDKVLSYLWGARTLILTSTLLAAASSVIYSLLLTNIFLSQAVFISPQSKQDQMSNFLAQLPAMPLISGAGAMKNGNAEPLEILKAHLRTKENLWKVINKFKLKHHYGITSDYEVDVENAYLRNLNISKSKKTGLVTISFEDSVPQLARDVVNYNLNLLSEISKTAVITENQKKMLFLADRVGKAKKELERIEENIRKYQESHSILSIEKQAQATIDATSKLQAEMLLNRIKQKVLLQIGKSESHPEIRILELELEALRNQVEQIEKSGAVMKNILEKENQFMGLTYIPLKKIPSLKLEMERFLREKLVQQEIYKVLARENELVKIEASKEQRGIEVIDWASLPEKKHKPRRSIICIVLTSSVFLFSCLVSILRGSLIKSYSKFQ